VVGRLPAHAKGLVCNTFQGSQLWTFGGRGFEVS